MEMKIVGITVAILVSITVLAGVLMPVLEDATATTDTFTNDGVYYMENPEESVSVKFLGGTAWEIDGESLDYTSIGSTNIIVTDSLFVRNNGQVRGSTTASWTTADLTIGNGTITGTAVVSGSSTSVSYTYDVVYVATNDDSAGFVMTLPTGNTYINADSELIGKGLTSVKDSTGGTQFVVFDVNVENLTATVTSTTAAITISNVTVNYTTESDHIDLYKFRSVEFDAVWGEYTTHCTYNVLIAPSEVTAERSVHFTDNQNALLAVIPMLVIVALLIGVVALVIRSRLD